MDEAFPFDENKVDAAKQGMIDYLTALFASDDKQAVDDALAMWNLVHGVIGVDVRYQPTADMPGGYAVDLSGLQDLVKYQFLGASIVASQLLLFMEEKTGRSVKNLLAEFVTRLSSD
jgi:hypothetical protein